MIQFSRDECYLHEYPGPRLLSLEPERPVLPSFESFDPALTLQHPVGVSHSVLHTSTTHSHSLFTSPHLTFHSPLTLHSPVQKQAPHQENHHIYNPTCKTPPQFLSDFQHLNINQPLTTNVTTSPLSGSLRRILASTNYQIDNKQNPATSPRTQYVCLLDIGIKSVVRRDRELGVDPVSSDIA